MYFFLEFSYFLRKLGHFAGDSGRRSRHKTSARHPGNAESGRNLRLILSCWVRGPPFAASTRVNCAALLFFGYYFKRRVQQKRQERRENGARGARVFRGIDPQSTGLARGDFAPCVLVIRSVVRTGKPPPR